MESVSFWEKETFLKNIDLAIVGSGIVGLTAAIRFKKLFPTKSVTIFERGALPFGASSKNAGFACFGSITELLSDLDSMSEDEVLKLVELRWKGLSELRSLLGDQTIDFQNNGGFELFTPNDQEQYDKAIAGMEYLNKSLNSIVGPETFIKVDSKISEFGFNNTNHLILNKYEGQIDTGKMISSLADLALNLGVRIINGVEIRKIQDSNKVTLGSNLGQIEASKALIATNGLTKLIFPELDVKPARAQVLITTPIHNLKVKGTFHYEQGYYYFRNVGNRLLFGGGRNLSLTEEESTEIKTTELIQSKLEELLRTVIIPNKNFSIEHRWAGIMGVSDSKTTISEHLSDNVFCAVRLGGMGVAIGSIIGKNAINKFMGIQ